MSNCWLRLPLELFGNALKNGANAATVAAVANDALFDDSNELALIVTADDDDDDDDPLESDTFESLSAACSLDCSLFVICSLLLLSIISLSLLLLLLLLFGVDRLANKELAAAAAAAAATTAALRSVDTGLDEDDGCCC